MAKKSSLKIKCRSLNSELPCSYCRGRWGRSDGLQKPGFHLLLLPRHTVLGQALSQSRRRDTKSKHVSLCFMLAGPEGEVGSKANHCCPAAVWVHRGESSLYKALFFKPSFILPIKPVHMTPSLPSVLTSSCLFAVALILSLPWASVSSELYRDWWASEKGLVKHLAGREMLKACIYL